MHHTCRAARIRHEREHIIALINGGVCDLDELIATASRRLGAFRARVAVQRLIGCGDIVLD